MAKKRPWQSVRLLEGYQPKVQSGSQPPRGKVNISVLKPPSGGSAIQRPKPNGESKKS